MTGRDLAWRMAGAVLIILGSAPAIVTPPEGAAIWSVLTMIGLVSAIAGIVLLVNGRRVAMVLRIERSPHRLLPLRIHARRRSRRP